MMNHSSIDRRAFFALAGAAGTSLALFSGVGGKAATTRFAVTRSPADWRRILGPQRYAILREGGTERAYTSPLLNEHRKGRFACAGCALPLFSSSTKFDSGTGWPSFWAALPHAIVTRADHSFAIERTETLCMRCGGHLGHVFHDGPQPTGLRYCMNGLALQFTPA